MGNKQTGNDTLPTQNDLIISNRDGEVDSGPTTYFHKNQVKSKKQAVVRQQSLAKNTAYERIEARIPLSILDIREYEGRLKKLVYGKETISLRQMQFVFSRDFEDFDDLNNENSVLYKILTSSVFKSDETDAEMNIQYLMLFGLLYCHGSIEEKSTVLYDVLQDGLQEVISASDKDLKDCFKRMINMASSVIHKWSQEFGDEEVKNSGIDPIFGNTESQEWNDALETIEEQFLDLIFDVQSRIKRDEFIKEVTKKGSYLFKPAEIRKMIKQQMS